MWKKYADLMRLTEDRQDRCVTCKPDYRQMKKEKNSDTENRIINDSKKLLQTTYH